MSNNPPSWQALIVLPWHSQVWAFDARTVDPTFIEAPNMGLPLHTGKRMTLPVQAPAPVIVWNDCSDDFINMFCALIEDGETLRSISKMPGMPSADIIRRWMRKNRTFMQRYEAARFNRADARSDELDSLNTQMRNGELDPDIAREISKNLRWAMSKENAGRYGEKIQTVNSTTVNHVTDRKIFDWNSLTIDGEIE